MRITFLLVMFVFGIISWDATIAEEGRPSTDNSIKRNCLYIYGRVIEVDIKKSRIVIEHLDIQGGKPVRVKGIYRCTERTILEGIESLKDIEIGSNVEVYYRKTGNEQVIERLILDIKGNKEEEG